MTGSRVSEKTIGIKAVAARAGVSQTTVSLALNNIVDIWWVRMRSAPASP